MSFRTCIWTVYTDSLLYSGCIQIPFLILAVYTYTIFYIRAIYTYSLPYIGCIHRFTSVYGLYTHIPFCILAVYKTLDHLNEVYHLLPLTDLFQIETVHYCYYYEFQYIGGLQWFQTVVECRLAVRWWVVETGERPPTPLCLWRPSLWYSLADNICYLLLAVTSLVVKI